MRLKRTSYVQAAGLIGLLLAWALASDFIRSDALPSPLRVLDAAFGLLGEGVLVHHTMVSLRRVVIGFALGVAAGVALGLLAGLSWFASRTVHVLIELLRPVPGIAWLPLAVLWFGLGESSKVFLIAIGVFFPVFVGTVRGIRQTDPLHVRSAQALGASRWQVIRDVLIPSASPEILTGQRVGLSLGFIYMVAAELIGGRSGLGYMIAYARISGQPDQIYVGILVIGLLNLSLGAIQWLIERHMLRWHFGLDQFAPSLVGRAQLKQTLGAQ
jgi:ABC-type nitrate/sulfonate/bicarbonate transport system permease component